MMAPNMGQTYKELIYRSRELSICLAEHHHIKKSNEQYLGVQVQIPAES